MKLIEFLTCNENEKSALDLVELDLAEFLHANQSLWNLLRFYLHQAFRMKQIILTGSIPLNDTLKKRLNDRLKALLNNPSIKKIKLHKDVVNELLPEFYKNYSDRIIIQDHKPITNVNEVLNAYHNDEQGILIRQTSTRRFMYDDWLSIINPGHKTRLLSATFVIHDVPIALIGNVPSEHNSEWKDLSGIIFSHKTTCHFAGKSDMSTDLYYLKRIGLRSRIFDEEMVTNTGSIDYEKMYKKNEFLRQFGAKVKKNIPELRAKILEQRNRIHSGSPTYQTTHGKIKPNSEKKSVEEFGILINNEALLEANKEDIVGVYLNTEIGASITAAFEIQDFLAKHEIYVGLFTYNPFTKTFSSVMREEILQEPATTKKLSVTHFSKIKPSICWDNSTTTTLIFNPYAEAQCYNEYFSSLGVMTKITNKSLLIFEMPVHELMQQN